MTGTTYCVIPPGSDWDAVLARFSDSGQNDIYFDHRYVGLYAEEAAVVCGFVFEKGEDVLFLPHIRRGIPTPVGDSPLRDIESAYGYTGPISTSSEQAFLHAAWAAFHEYCEAENVVAGFFRFHPLLENHRYAEASDIRVVADRKTVYLDLDRDEDAVWQGYTSDNRNRIRKAIKSGITVKGREDRDALRAFSRVYHAHMAELRADPGYLFGEAYFDAIAELGKGRYRVYLAQADGNTIGGALVLFSDRFAHYHLSSSLREHFHRAPNNMLRHTVIMDLLGQRWSKLHFGGGRGRDPDDTLLRFKRMFSRQETQFFIGSLVADETAYEAIRTAWARAHPDKLQTHGRRTLCYRYC